MNPQLIFCPNIDCPARGQAGKGNIGVHSAKDGRYICHECKRTFSGRKGTMFYRLRSDTTIVVLVITLMAYGCPLQAIVKAFGCDERTVKEWWQRSGEHCRVVHEHMVEQRQLNLEQVQADEIKARTQGGSVWMAMAMMVSTRLWLGGVISPTRDYALIEQLVAKVRHMALCRPLLLAVDGLVSYVSAFQAAFRSPLPRHGQQGRSKLVAWPNITIVQVVKHRTASGLDIVRRIVQGSETLVAHLLLDSQGGGVINTAYIERLNATFRQRLACLARRTRFLVQDKATLTAGMFIVGCFYNFCDEHQSLRKPLWITERRKHWVQRTPAMAAGLTDHRWTPTELFAFKVPPPPWSPPTRRGRPSKQTLVLVERWGS
jgi:transposase-like protein